MGTFKNENKRFTVITPEKEQFIIENASKMTLAEMGRELMVDDFTIGNFCKKKGITPAKRKATEITEEQKQYFLENRTKKSISKLVEETGVDRRKIAKLFQDLGHSTSRDVVITEKQEQYILANYKNISLTEMSSIIDVDRRNISSFLYSKGITVQSGKIEFNTQDINKIKELRKTKTLDEIAEIYGCSRPTIAKLLK